MIFQKISSCSFIPLTSPTSGSVCGDPSLYFTTPCIPNNPLKVKPLLMCQSLPCKRVFVRGCSEVWEQNSPPEWSWTPALWCFGRSPPLPLYLYLPAVRSLLLAVATLLTMSRPSTDSIWSDLRKRTGTITLFSFFRWVPSERRKEGRGEEVNKPSAFLQQNKETLDRHLFFSMK